MLRLFCAGVLAVFLADSALAQGRLASAMEAVRAKDWPTAAQTVARQDKITQDIIAWHQLRAGQGSARDALDFLERRGDWPGLPYLRKQMEPAFSTASTQRVLQFFNGNAPQTAEGALVYARVLQQSGQNSAANAVITTAWTSMPMSAEEQTQFLGTYGRLLSSKHTERMDHLLWQGWTQNATNLMPHVTEGWQKLAQARMALRDDKAGVDGFIAAVPNRLKSDPGLAFERFQWRARKGRNADAIELALAQSKANQLGNAGAWAGWRRALVRSDMRAGRHQQAYQLASGHGLTSGSAYADLEWLSGYLALRFLNKPKTALQHFVRFEQAVETPISYGRAGYWIGRAYEAMGDKSSAQRAYQGGAQHQTSFYGLLAAEKAGAPFDVGLNAAAPANWRQSSFTQSSVHAAAQTLLAAGELSLAERFWTHLAETQTPQVMAQMGQMALDLNEPHLAVMLGKRFAQYGQTIAAPYYALHPLAKRRDLPVPAEMALSIARRESEFDPRVVSGANAQGLMQILPGTAKEVAGDLGLAYSKARLLSDPDYNVTLGTAYLAGLVEEFNGNVIMVAAGYNAGPSRPTRWMAANGDPRRRGGMDIVDWIEHIPFNETRNYVMRVAESLPVYRARLGKRPLPIPFSRELVGSSLNSG